jgi:heme exporter protein D
MLEALTPWWPDFASFLRMGRHGFYVWASFGACALALGLEWLALKRAMQNTERP